MFSYKTKRNITDETINMDSYNPFILETTLLWIIKDLV